MRAHVDISVVVPAYNREDTVAETLESLLAQTHAGWEAIVVDDGSQDGTARVVEEYSARDPRFRLHRQRNGGVSAARNRGVELARMPWLFFLDADDWVAPEAFELLAEALTGADAACGGCVRVMPGGEHVPEPRPRAVDDLFPVFARMCAFPIHTCLVRTELVREVGAFDETLVTCEDWDLWQRLARASARFVSIPDVVSYYRVRPRSASADGSRMLDDGLRVIDWGHGVDQRLNGSLPFRRSPLTEADRRLARTYFFCYTAGLTIGQGGDVEALLARPPGELASEVEPSGVADTLIGAVAIGRGIARADWIGLPRSIGRAVEDFFDALGDAVGNPLLGVASRTEMERSLLKEARGDQPLTIGRWHRLTLDLDAPQPLPDLFPPAGAERVLIELVMGGEGIGTIELPVIDGQVHALVVLDAVAAELAWEVVWAWLRRELGDELRTERAGADGVRAFRGDTLLYDGPLDGARSPDEVLRDSIGWVLMLQELFGEPAAGTDDFYLEERRSRQPREARWVRGGERVEVEVSEPLPDLRSSARSVSVGVTVAGVPVTMVSARVRRGWIPASELRRVILLSSGFELCRLVVREGMLPGAGTGTLRERLAARAVSRRRELAGRSNEHERYMHGWQPLAATLAGGREGITLIGRRARGVDGTAASRCAVLPHSTREVLLEAALTAGDPVVEVGAEPALVAYAPFLVWDRAQHPWREPDGAAWLYARRRRLPSLGRGQPPRPEGATARLPILMYHRVAPDGASRTRRWRVRPEEFEAQLDLMRRLGYRSITLDEWTGAHHRRRPLDGRAVLITFDDGYLDFVEHALPLLEEYGFSAMISVVTDLVGKTNVWDRGLGEELELMDWDLIEHVHRRGFQIGSHSSRHSPLVRSSVEELVSDLSRSRSELELRLAAPVPAVTYPYGLTDPTVAHVAGACGFTFGLTTHDWKADLSEPLMSLPRLEVRGTASLEEFEAMLAG